MPAKSSKKITFQTSHRCKLNKLELGSELPTYPPYAPSYIKTLYSFTRKWTTASRTGPHSKEYFRSKRTLLNEKRRQLEDVNYRMIIHPLSKLYLLERTSICGLWFVAFIVDPFFGSFLSNLIQERDTSFQDSLLLFMNILFGADIIFNFFVGFTIDHTKEIVLDQDEIAKRYFSTFFIFDFIPVVHQLVYHILKSTNFHIIMNMVPLYFFRFARLYSMIKYFSDFLYFLKMHESMIKCLSILLIQLLLIHWWTCILYLLPAIGYYLRQPHDDSWIRKSAVGTRRTLFNIYIDTLLGTACHYVGAGKGNIGTGNPVEQFTLAFILMCGMSVHIYIIALILQLFGTMNISETKYEELIFQLNEYMLTKKFPASLRQRLHMYYEYRFQKQFFHEHLILASLSEHLRCEVLLYNCQNLIERMKLLQGASKDLIGAIVMLLKHEIYLPNDTIIKSESYNECIYFISYGTVFMHLDNGKEAYHLEDGHHFGEMHIALQNQGEQCTANVIAAEITEVFYLEKKDFMYIVTTYPEIVELLERSAMNKLSIYRYMMSESNENIDATDILAELRRGHILEQGRRRI